MKKSRFSESQIISVIQRNERGEKVKDLCRELEKVMQRSTTGRRNMGGLSVKQLKRLKELEQENARLMSMYAELSRVHHALKDAVERKS